MEENCVICGAENCISEIIKISRLKTCDSIQYFTRFSHCSECGVDTANHIHMHLNKLEMLIALEKEKALQEQSIIN